MAVPHFPSIFPRQIKMLALVMGCIWDNLDPSFKHANRITTTQLIPLISKLQTNIKRNAISVCNPQPMIFDTECFGCFASAGIARNAPVMPASSPRLDSSTDEMVEAVLLPVARLICFAMASLLMLPPPGLFNTSSQSIPFAPAGMGASGETYKRLSAFLS